MIGTDKKQFVNLLGAGDMPIDWFPFYPLDSSVYIPLEELPEGIRILYTYNPELAKKMLADEGYPNGFKMELNARPEPESQDRASLVKDQWAKIGVDVEIKVYDAATIWEMNLSSSFKHATMGGWEGADPVSSLLRTYETGTDLNYPNYSNPKVDPIINQIKVERELSERVRLAKEAYEIIRYECPEVTLEPTLIGHFWWPWLKNYYGEANVGDWGNPMPILAYIWIDQDLKNEMGY
jgi:peptide/nickel transport system substrate-binding protein